MAKRGLAEQFESFATQDHAARLGMWMFLASEILLFAGLFALYGSYRAMYGEAFVEGVRHNNLWLGSLNTLVLITSSFTVAMAVHSIRVGKRKRALVLVLVTLAFAVTFLVVKTIEYAEHFHHGIKPGELYSFAEMPSFGARTFFTVYFFMTGLHALHVLIGMGVLIWCCTVLRKPDVWGPEHHIGLELGGLYWHLVDVVWIFLWPLLYLAR